LFFPVGNSGPALAQIADAKLVCNRCPVTTECLTWALDSGQDAGVWGGMSEDERRALKRRNARTKARSGVYPQPRRFEIGYGPGKVCRGRDCVQMQFLRIAARNVNFAKWITICDHTVRLLG